MPHMAKSGLVRQPHVPPLSGLGCPPFQDWGIVPTKTRLLEVVSCEPLMTALGQKQTFANGHVRFTPKSRHVRCNERCMLWAKSGLMQRNKSLFDHLISAERQSWRDVQSDHVGGREVDYQLVLGRCLNWQFARLLAPQNAIGVSCSPPPLIDLIRPVRHQTALGCEISERIDRRQAVPRRR